MLLSFLPERMALSQIANDPSLTLRSPDVACSWHSSMIPVLTRVRCAWAVCICPSLSLSCSFKSYPVCHFVKFALEILLSFETVEPLRHFRPDHGISEFRQCFQWPSSTPTTRQPLSWIMVRLIASYTIKSRPQFYLKDPPKCLISLLIHNTCLRILKHIFN